MLAPTGPTGGHMARINEPKREHTLSIRLNDEEQRAYDRAADGAGTSQTAKFVRDEMNARLGISEPATGTLDPRIIRHMREQTRALNRVARLLEKLVDSVQVATEEDLLRIERAVLSTYEVQPD